jgi:hypothetical protein
MFDKTISKSSTFINNDNAEIPVENAEILAPTNYYKADGLEIAQANAQTKNCKRACKHTSPPKNCKRA